MDLMIYLHGGNEAANTTEDFALILKKLAEKIEEGAITFETGTASLRDMNGNTVGFINFKEPQDA